MKLRLRYAKAGKVRFTSHRDVARIWERALRRVQLPVAYSEGFSPRPKLSFGLALPTGAESVAEYLDVELDDSRITEGGPDLAILPALLSAALPVGIDVVAVAAVDQRADSLQQAVTSCTWHIEALGLTPDDAAGLVEAALAAPEIVVTRQRKGKEVTDDLRPAVLHVAVAGVTGDGTELVTELGVHPRSVRPTELLAAVAPGVGVGRVRRTHQWIEREGAREEPLPHAAPVDATSRPHAEARAS